jgi:hypothetical protein
MADERLYEFPSKSTPTPADIVYLGDAADAFNEVNSTIEEIISAYPNLIGMADLVMGNETFPYKNAIGVWSAGAINTFGIAIIGSVNSEVSSVLATDGSGIPLLVDTLPTQVQSNITQIGAQAEALDMNSHLINNVTDPVSLQDAATKRYVDLISAGRKIKDPCNAATTGALTVTYNNGASGVGATLTNAGALAAFSVDGYSASLNDRILVKNQASTFQNGIYVVTTVGSGAVAWVLTRSTDMDMASQFLYATTFILNGSTQNGQTYTETATVVTIGTDPVSFSLTGDATAVTSVATGTGLTGGTITSTGTISLAAANDQTLKGNVSGGSAAPIDLTKSQVLTMLSNPINQINIQRVTATGAGTYTPTSGMVYVMVEAQAAGGGGGGAAAAAAGQGASAAGGGGGEYIRALFTAAQIGASKAYSVGAKGTGGAAGANNGTAGGNTTFNTTWIVTNGGGGGSGRTSTASLGIIQPTSGTGGNGGSVATGTLIDQNAGSFGQFSMQISAANSISGSGGNAGDGSAGGIFVLSSSANGTTAPLNSGAGGAGASSNNGAAAAGGDGGDGYINFIEYISA